MSEFTAFIHRTGKGCSGRVILPVLSHHHQTAYAIGGGAPDFACTGKGAALPGAGELLAGRALKTMGLIFAAQSRRKQLSYSL